MLMAKMRPKMPNMRLKIAKMRQTHAQMRAKIAKMMAKIAKHEKHVFLYRFWGHCRGAAGRVFVHVQVAPRT